MNSFFPIVSFDEFLNFVGLLSSDFSNPLRLCKKELWLYVKDRTASVALVLEV